MPRYIAYILKPHGDPAAVDLGDAATIEALVADFQKKLHKPRDESVMQTARQLDARIMQPVRQCSARLTRYLSHPMVH